VLSTGEELIMVKKRKEKKRSMMTVEYNITQQKAYSTANILQV